MIEHILYYINDGRNKIFYCYTIVELIVPYVLFIKRKRYCKFNPFVCIFMIYIIFIVSVYRAKCDYINRSFVILISFSVHFTANRNNNVFDREYRMYQKQKLLFIVWLFFFFFFFLKFDCFIKTTKQELRSTSTRGEEILCHLSYLSTELFAIKNELTTWSFRE